MVRRAGQANQHYFHVQCFLCVICNRELETGDEFFIVNGHMLLCKDDYHEHHQYYQGEINYLFEFLPLSQNPKLHKIK